MTDTWRWNALRKTTKEEMDAAIEAELQEFRRRRTYNPIWQHEQATLQEHLENLKIVNQHR